MLVDVRFDDAQRARRKGARIGRRPTAREELFCIHDECGFGVVALRSAALLLAQHFRDFEGAGALRGGERVVRASVLFDATDRSFGEELRAAAIDPFLA